MIASMFRIVGLALVGLGFSFLVGVVTGVWLKERDEEQQGFPRSRRYHR